MTGTGTYSQQNIIPIQNANIPISQDGVVRKEYSLQALKYIKLHCNAFSYGRTILNCNISRGRRQAINRSR